MGVVVSFLIRFVIFFSLYFTFFWILVMFSVPKKKFVMNENSYPSVSILIAAYNEEKTLEKTLRSCLDISYPGRFNVVVVNDGSADKTLEIAKRFESESDGVVRVVDLERNLGKAGALNEGLKRIDSDFFAVVDADSSVDSLSLRKGIEEFFSAPKGERVGAVICKMRPLNESGNILERLQVIEYMLAGLIRFLTSSLRILNFTNGVLSIYRTGLVREIGGFDAENLTEDYELGMRIRRTGNLVVYSQASMVYTNTPGNLKDFLKQRIRWSRGFIRTNCKHRDVLFNPKYGMFGCFQFPLNIFSYFVFFLGVFAISINVYRKLYEFVFKLVYARDIISWFDFGSFREFLLRINTGVDVLLVFNLLIFLVLVFGFVNFYGYNYFKKEPFKRAFAFVVYIMFYSYIYIYVWIISVIREVRGDGYSWGTK